MCDAPTLRFADRITSPLLNFEIFVPSSYRQNYLAADHRRDFVSSLYRQNYLAVLSTYWEHGVIFVLLKESHKSVCLDAVSHGAMIWDNFSIFRSNCAITFDTRAYMLRGFFRITYRRNGEQNFWNLLCFWPTTLRVCVCWNFALVFSS